MLSARLTVSDNNACAPAIAAPDSPPLTRLLCLVAGRSCKSAAQCSNECRSAQRDPASSLIAAIASELRSDIPPALWISGASGPLQRREARDGKRTWYENVTDRDGVISRPWKRRGTPRTFSGAKWQSYRANGGR
jgi:hypothetical protein